MNLLFPEMTWASVMCAQTAEETGAYAYDFYHEQEMNGSSPTNSYRIHFEDLKVRYTRNEWGIVYEDLELKEQLPEEIQWYLSELYDV